MNNNVPLKNVIPPDVRCMIVKWIVQAIIGVVGYGVLIFAAAGSVRWVWGWMLLIVIAGMMAAHPLLLIPINPELLAERAKGTRDQGVMAWDKRITGLAGLMMLLTWGVAGLDIRFQWTGSMPLAFHVVGLTLTILGYALFIWAMVANAFFAEGVRIQSERGHVVATEGPYRFVRHPGYAGVLLAHSTTPFLLGSLWSLIPAGILCGLFVLRTALEDRMLQVELDGYQVYAAQVRYRLLPGVW